MFIKYNKLILASSLIIFLPFLINIPIYPDEQANYLTFYSSGMDRVINNLLPICKNFFEKSLPYVLLPSRGMIELFNSLILDRTINFLIYLIIYFIINIILYLKISKLIKNDFTIILLIFYVGVSLVYVRTESQFLIYLLLTILLYIKYKESKPFIIVIVLIYLYTVLINLHGRSILLFPLYLFICLSL